ncbi:MAG: hypothetical protein WBG71_04365 [Leeuwenhoekiella sp.]
MKGLIITVIIGAVLYAFIYIRHWYLCRRESKKMWKAFEKRIEKRNQEYDEALKKALKAAIPLAIKMIQDKKTENGKPKTV